MIDIDNLLQISLPFFSVFVALLMVSRIPYPHVVNQIFRGQKTFAHVVGVVFAIMTVMLIHGYAIPIIFCGFVFYGPARFVWQRWRHRKEKEEPMF
jgi:phosphatidylserine synthase